MDDDDVLAQFTAITSADPERASQYLRLTENNLEQALQLYFESDGVDMSAPLPSASQQPAPVPQASRPTIPPDAEVVQIDSDDDDQDGSSRPQPNQEAAGAGGTLVEDDEAMARRLQEEMYGGQEGSGGLSPQSGVRAPIGRTTETLLGDESDWRQNPDELNAAVAQQMLSRQNRNAGRPGIFNQQVPLTSSIWESDTTNPDARRRDLSRATGGASETSSKASMLAEMFRPPFELMSPLRSWEGVRAEGKENEKWILVNVQDPNVFDCQVLNRDIWKNPQIQETVKEHFIFKQYNKNDPLALNYVRFYFQAYESQDAYPHIAIIDPRTGEQVKVWSGSPAPKAPEFLMQLHEFLDRYSLKANSKNPVATRKPEKRKEMNVDKMTEEEMMELAMQNSLESRPGPKESDPDTLTRGAATPSGQAAPSEEDGNDATNGAGAGTATPSPFSLISSTNPHFEPAANAPNTTRIQFRHPGGRIIRRFGLTEPVRRIFEWMKAEPMEGMESMAFELIFMGKNLMDVIDLTIEEAGLKNGSIMVEFVEDE